jgi:hypothetical protein
MLRNRSLVSVSSVTLVTFLLCFVQQLVDSLPHPLPLPPSAIEYPCDYRGFSPAPNITRPSVADVLRGLASPSLSDVDSVTRPIFILAH